MLSFDPDSPCLVTCRENLEPLVESELKALDIPIVKRGKRAVFFEGSPARIYRANMALRTGLQVLAPIRTFNAKNYELLYFQSRKTNWHKLFDVDKTIRIDVNGGSDKLSHTQYVVHRVKDGIVDTFRKLKDGVRPSIAKDDPDIHVIVHLDGLRVTLLLDTSGTPLSRRGYRTQHGGAPLKEDLAAGMLMYSGWDRKSSLIDPCCGSGTFLFEAWLMARNIAPNLHRRFAFENLFGYEAETHEAEKRKLIASQTPVPGEFQLRGGDLDSEVVSIARGIQEDSFPEAQLAFEEADCSDTLEANASSFLICNPPYGLRSGSDEDAHKVHQNLGDAIRNSHQKAAVYSANPEASKALPKAPKPPKKLLNGRLEGRLYVY